MKTRFDLKEDYPNAYKAVSEVESFVRHSSLDRIYLELLKIRASQINGCAYCIDLHAKIARKLGISEQRILLLSAWREAGNIYSDEEKLILQMTEEMTLIHQNGLSDDVYQKNILSFGETKTLELMMAIVSINSWNRLMIATHKLPDIE